MRFYKLLFWIDLDPFYTKFKCGHLGFLWAKVKIMYVFLETIAATGLKVGLSI